MAKEARGNRISKKGNGEMIVEQHNVYDDCLLPSADEIAKFNEVSTDILPWMMKRTEMEQDARIKFNHDRMGLAQAEVKHNHKYNMIALFMAFFIVLLFMGASFFLIMKGFETLGGIFAGGTAVMIILCFLKASKNKEVK